MGTSTGPIPGAGLSTDRRVGDGYPDGVSVIMTVLNEQGHLRESVSAIVGQDWAGPLQVVIALGPSTDDTDRIAAELVESDSRVQTVANPTGKTPIGLNEALAQARYQVVARVDGHCLLPSDYLSTAVRVLERTSADNVGGVMAAEGVTEFEQAVACAMRSKIGVGSSSFHVGGSEGPAETVYLGVFRRDALERVGGYDPSFERAQDWEMNHRITKSGGLVWFTPELQVAYRPRPNVKALAKQYYYYGRWRRHVMREHAGTASARYLAAPVAVSAIVVGTSAGVLGCAVRRLAPLRVGWLMPAGYLAAVVAGGLIIGGGKQPSVRVKVPVALATMHLSWGIGFLTSSGSTRPVGRVRGPGNTAP
ncbi:MAG: glycosyltransferase family 2 protein [Actinomycetes bacterium]